MKYSSFINFIKGNTLRVPYLNAVYYSSILLKVMYVYNLMHHNNGHHVYVITYSVRKMKFSALSASA